MYSMVSYTRLVSQTLVPGIETCQWRVGVVLEEHEASVQRADRLKYAEDVGGAAQSREQDAAAVAQPRATCRREAVPALRRRGSVACLGHGVEHAAEVRDEHAKPLEAAGESPGRALGTRQTSTNKTGQRLQRATCLALKSRRKSRVEGEEMAASEQWSWRREVEKRDGDGKRRRRVREKAK
jgi:hypothetical protein